MFMKKFFIVVVLFCFFLFCRNAFAQTTGFTYQGRLDDGGASANGNFDFEFALFDALTDGSQTGPTVALNGVGVTDGIFSVLLDFGDQFSGASRFLEIRVRPAGGGAFTVLSPRQMLASAPYAVRSLNASQLGGVAAGQFVQTNDVRLSDARNPLPNSPNYIINSTVLQPESNFSISGNGTAGGTLSGNVVNSATQFDINNSRVLASFFPAGNLFVGHNAGSNNTGSSNTFVGFGAGSDNNSGSSNAFFGFHSGFRNTTGAFNAFFGYNSGLNNSTGSNNSFFGLSSGGNNTTGSNNSFFGRFSGIDNTTGSDNSLFGSNSNILDGLLNASAFGFRAFVGQSNSLVLGSIAGVNGASVGTSVGIGTPTPARLLHLSGTGVNAPGRGDLQITGTGTIGSGLTFESTSTGGRSYSLFSTANSAGSGGGKFAVFDVNAGAYRLVVDSAGNIGIGTTAPTEKLHVAGNGFVSGNLTVNGTLNFGGSRAFAFPATDNTFGGFNAGASNTASVGNTYFGNSAGQLNTTGGQNSLFGAKAGQNNTGTGNSFFGFNAGLANTSGGDNSFFGNAAGDANTTANFNSFFGTAAGGANTTGSQNSFFGRQAGFLNVTGSENAFFGNSAGRSNTASFNSFFGSQAGFGTTTGSANAFFGAGSGQVNTTGSSNTFIGRNAGNTNTTGGSNTFIGDSAGASNVTGSNNTLIGADTNIPNGSSFVTVIGAGAQVGDVGPSPQNSVYIGRSVDTVIIRGEVFVFDSVDISGQVSSILGVSGTTPVCHNAARELSLCSSSIRYKENVNPFSSGFDIIRRLKPVTFDWKSNKMPDFGLIAEDVAGIDPLLVTRNADGEVEGVKYDRLGVVLVNAVKEQQEQIESLEKRAAEQTQIISRQQEQLSRQEKLLADQQAAIESLKQMICSQTPAAAICVPKVP